MRNKKLTTNESRRNFLKKSVIGGVTVAAFPSISFGKKSESASLQSLDIKPGELDEITIDEIRNGDC